MSSGDLTRPVLMSGRAGGGSGRASLWWWGGGCWVLGQVSQQMGALMGFHLLGAGQESGTRLRAFVFSAPLPTYTPGPCAAPGPGLWGSPAALQVRRSAQKQPESRSSGKVCLLQSHTPDLLPPSGSWAAYPLIHEGLASSLSLSISVEAVLSWSRQRALHPTRGQAERLLLLDGGGLLEQRRRRWWTVPRALARVRLTVGNGNPHCPEDRSDRVLGIGRPSCQAGVLGPLKKSGWVG